MEKGTNAPLSVSGRLGTGGNQRDRAKNPLLYRRNWSVRPEIVRLQFSPPPIVEGLCQTVARLTPSDFWASEKSKREVSYC